MAVEHPTHDTFWHERDTRVRLGVVDIPVYLGCDWDNAPLHLPCTFGAWKALKHNPNVCMSPACSRRTYLAIRANASNSPANAAGSHCPTRL